MDENNVHSFLSIIFTTDNNFNDFLFASLDNKALQKWGSSLTGKNLLIGSKFFPVRIDSIEKGDTSENGRVDSPESVPIHLQKSCSREQTQFILFQMYVIHPIVKYLVNSTASSFPLNRKTGCV